MVGESERLTRRELTEDEKAELQSHLPTDEETQCAVPWLQFFASKKTYIVLFGLTMCAHNCTYMYWNCTLTTIQKRYQLDTATTGVIFVAHDIVLIFSSILCSYFASKGHRPRWMALGSFCLGLYTFFIFLPHWLYGPGEDAYLLSKEYMMSQFNLSDSDSTSSSNKMGNLCSEQRDEEDCSKPISKFSMPAIIMFVGTMISGIAEPLLHNVGMTFMDDNVQKVEAPVYFSLVSFVNFLALPLGATLASIFLKVYIAPSLTPVIDDSDPRWMGAWWAAWALLTVYFMLATVFFFIFPQTLPRGAYRKRELINRILDGKEDRSALKVIEKASVQDIKQTFLRVVRNKTYMCNMFAGCFYVFGYTPFINYQAKYIESQYLLSASDASMVTGTVSLVFLSIGILTSGLVISKFKMNARTLALWNICTSLIAICGIITYIFSGCPANDNNLIIKNSETSLCNQNCNCEHINYSPVCGVDNKTYISPCHAGCTDSKVYDNGTVIYLNCNCVGTSSSSQSNGGSALGFYDELTARSGVCPVDCMRNFYVFFAVLCFLKFIAGTEGSANFLLGLRCVDERDRTVSIGINMTFISIIALVPAPVFFGALMDSTCLLWEKTCSTEGNCWLYDTASMRILLDSIGAALIFIGTMFDVGTWYFSKDVEIFDSIELNSEANKDIDD